MLALQENFRLLKDLASTHWGNGGMKLIRKLSYRNLWESVEELFYLKVQVSSLPWFNLTSESSSTL